MRLARSVRLSGCAVVSFSSLAFDDDGILRRPQAAERQIRFIEEHDSEEQLTTLWAFERKHLVFEVAQAHFRRRRRKALALNQKEFSPSDHGPDS